MHNFNKKAFQKCSLLGGVILICAGMAVQGQDAGKEPISFIGHGAMFDQNGQEVAPTTAFIRTAQAWYRNYLVEKLTKAQRSEFDNLEGRLTANLVLDEQSRLVLNAHLIDWLIKTAKTPDSGRIQGKNNLMKMYLKTKLPEKPDVNLPRSVEPFKIQPELDKRLQTESKAMQKRTGALQLTTGTGGAAYRSLCQTNGVPIPPDIGTSGWVSRGQIPQSQLFIVAGLKAEVMTFQSASPVGMCIALPRFDTSNQVQLDGVICLGQTSSKACFWDNEKNGATNVFTRGTVVPFVNFGGGTELLAGVGGVCSDCHAGENPYIIHDAILNSLAGLGLPTFPNNWHDPIVRTGDTQPWPENPGPMNAPPVPAACASCHFQGFAGRFPHLSTALPGYCTAVLRTSVGALPLKPIGQATAPPTMPPSNPGGLVCTPNLPASDPRYRACTLAMTASCNPVGSTLMPSDPLYLQCTPELSALLNWCGVPSNGSTSDRGDPHLTTFTGVNYDFQSAGEFVSLRHANGTEIHTRQTPVATASIVGPDPQTGLTSCVSVNTAVAARVGRHRVTYQLLPSIRNNQNPGFQVRVDGKLATVPAQGLDLGDGGRIVNSAVGGGIEIFFPDKTHVIAVPNFWGPPNNTWYLNVDVLNTPAREGVMGTILAGSWLPTLPDGTTLGPKPSGLHQRYTDLNQKFANAWRVTDGTSLFDYVPGTSTKTFTNPGWPPENPPCKIPDSIIPPAQPIERAKALQLCTQIVDKNMKSQCVFDVMVTGEAGFAKAYLYTQILRSRTISTK